MSTWWQLRKMVPAIMAVAATVNLALCFLPLDWLTFRTWEAATGSLKRNAVGPFEPDSEIRNDHAYGDLANIGNMRDMRQYRREEFRVDHFGFRNSSAPHPNSAGLVIGDSFTAGAALSDSDTLAVRLTDVTGGFFYNAGGEKACLENAEAAAAILRLYSGVLVFELLERNAWRSPPELSRLRADCFPPPDRGPEKSRIPATVTGRRTLELAFSDHSPLAIISRRMIRRLQNGVWLPNPYSSEVIRRKLRNGEVMLFYPEDFWTGSNATQLATKWTDYFAEFSARMAERNIRTIVLLVPNKTTVYAPLVDAGFRDFHGGAILNGIEGQLHLAGIPVLNMTAAFQESAKRGLDNRDYIYWRDDTHWNARGVSLAADCLSSEIRKQNLRRDDAKLADARDAAQAPATRASR